MPTKDFYDVLGVSRTASADDIKRAYRSLARRHHPDVAADKRKAEHQFKEINEAYEVLSDPRKRAQYDRYGTVGNGGGAGSSGFTDFGFSGGSGFGDIFDMFFGERTATHNASAPARGSDLRYDLEISLEEAFSGTTREIVFDHLAQCDVCRGSGAAPGTLVVPCDRCGGSGVTRVGRHTPLGQFVTQTACTKCGGEGQVIQEPCRACSGRGRREIERKLTVKVPAGVDDGSRIRIAGSGEGGVRSGPAGDLYVYLHIAPHSLFRRNGSDTSVEVPISFPQAALGAEISVPSLEGELTLTLPAGTQSGTVFRMRGHGMPSVRGASRGDHFVSVIVAVPTKLAKRQREMLEDYARAWDDDVQDRTFFEKVRDAFKPE